MANAVALVSLFASMEAVFIGMDERDLGDAGHDQRLHRGLFEINQRWTERLRRRGAPLAA
jgi:hypothetical protein